MYFGLKIEKFKKIHDIQTYRQILAITNGETLDAIQIAEERGKYPYQKAFIVLLFTVISVLLGVLASILIRFLF